MRSFLLIGMFTLVSCFSHVSSDYKARHKGKGVIKNRSSKKGYILGHIHVFKRLMQHNRSEVKILVENIASKKKHKIFCPISEQTNFMCYYFVPLPRGNYKFKNITFDSKDLKYKQIFSAKINASFSVRANQITYLLGYSLKQKYDRKSFVLLKSDNIVNSVEYLFETYKGKKFLNMPIRYFDTKKTILISSEHQQGINFFGNLDLKNINVRDAVLIVVKKETKELFQLFVRTNKDALKGTFFFSLPKGEYVVKKIYLPEENFAFEFPNKEVYTIEDQAISLGDIYFSYQDNLTIGVFTEYSDGLIESVSRNKGLSFKVIKQNDKLYMPPKSTHEKANFMGFLSINKRRLKKLILTVHNEGINQDFLLMVDYLAQPYFFHLPKGSYKLKKIRIFNHKDEWNLFVDKKRKRNFFDIVDGKVSFLGNLKVSLISQNVLSFDIEKSANDLARIKSFLPLKTQHILF